MALVLLRLAHAARMRPVIHALEVYHTIDAGEGCAIALVTMRIQFLLGEDITATLS